MSNDRTPIELDAKKIISALQSLGFYAEVADNKDNLIDSQGDIDTCRVVLTNADKDSIMKLFRSEDDFISDDEQINAPIYGCECAEGVHCGVYYKYKCRCSKCGGVKFSNEILNDKLCTDDDTTDYFCECEEWEENGRFEYQYRCNECDGLFYSNEWLDGYEDYYKDDDEEYLPALFLSYVAFRRNTDDSDTIHIVFKQDDFENTVIVKTKQPIKFHTKEVICFYSHSKEKYQPLSNFYLAELIDERMPTSEKHASVEHYFQFRKALMFEPDGEVARLLKNDMTEKKLSCKEVKSLGRKVQNFDKEKWHLWSRYFMYQALYAKYQQHDDLRELLLSTGDAILAEAAPRDTLWGIGYSESNPKAYDPSQWRGKNVLGNMLMYIREEIREVEQNG